MVQSAREEFVDLMAQNAMSNGLDELPSKIMGVLFIEPSEISLEELAEKTGYSLSAVSTSSKVLESLGVVKRLKKPKSKKVFYFMEKDIFGSYIRTLKMKHDQVIVPSKKKLPEIIERYMKKKSQSNQIGEELKIVQNYYRQIVAFDSIMNEMIEMLEDAYSAHVEIKKPSKH